MCRIYGQGKGQYVRACHATGHQGKRVMSADAVWGTSGHLVFGRARTHKKGGQAEPKSSPQQRQVLRIGAPKASDQAIAALISFANCTSKIEADAQHEKIITLYGVNKPTGWWLEVIRRALTYGWLPLDGEIHNADTTRDQ